VSSGTWRPPRRMEPLQRKGRPGAVADEPLDALPVIAQDMDGSIDAETTGSLPAEHAVGVWKWKWVFRLEPNRCRKLMAASWASLGAPGLTRHNVVRIARRKIRRTAPAMSGLW
jgi:hypothetical protein